MGHCSPIISSMQQSKMGTDQDWIEWGKRDPYFAVLTHDEYRSENLSELNRKAFFDDGRLQVATHLTAIRKHVDDDFRPQRVLDFGCGVGRVAIALAELDSVAEVVGVDISPAMLDEARRNCPEGIVHKLSLVQSDDGLTRIEGCFDLVHSSIVLQHIPVRRGLYLFARLVARVAPGGVGVFQVIFAKTSRRGSRFRESRVQAWLAQRAARLLVAVRRVLAIFGGAGRIDPVMEMNCYPLNELTWLLYQQGIRRYASELADHGGALAITLIFQRPADQVSSTASTR